MLCINKRLYRTYRPDRRCRCDWPDRPLRHRTDRPDWTHG